MKKNLICMAVATTFGLAAFSASADDMYRGAWYALPGINYNWTDGDVDADDDIGGFIKLGKELSPSWDVQVGGAYTRADEDSNLSSSGKYKQTLLGVDALYMFSRDKFRPFLLAGLGAARNKVDYNNIEWGGSKTSWMANLGVGFQYLINDTFGLQADLREVWSRAETGPAGNRDTETIGNTVLNLGAIFRFGAPAPAPVAAPEPTPEPVALAPEPAPAPAPAAPLPAMEPCKPTMETVTLQAERLFGFDKANLSAEGKADLDEVAAKIQARPSLEVVLITGHTDRIGSEAYNQKLSERRANVVKKYLISKGIPESRLNAVGKGESEPVVDCKGVRGSKKLIECLAPNRRVVITSEGKVESGCSN